MTDREKLERIKELIETEFSKYICGCYLVYEIGRIIEAEHGR